MRIVAIVLVLTLMGIVLWNVVGAVTLRDADDSYIGRASEGSLASKRINAGGIALVREWIETKTRPSFDPIKILIYQVWYNAITRGYDLKMWIEPEEYSGSLEQYAIYQFENFVVLRIEYSRRNRVLVTSFTAAELEEALQPFVVKDQF
ncbi:MAG: hypothetical protein HKN43_13545 [Rhodothermales bacterium]|nr:hypothetical protein [Rhodothermales bacterium]